MKYFFTILFCCGVAGFGRAQSEAFWSNSTGVGNTAVGSAALGATTQASYNTVVGYNSGTSYNNGYNNVFVGANNDVNGAGFYNVIAIGQGVICTASDQAIIGNTATNSIGGYANWTNSGYDFSGVDKPQNDKGFYGLRYGDFVVPLVKAVQEQQQLIKELQQEIADLKKQIQH